jgi:hypothetical protein
VNYSILLRLVLTGLFAVEVGLALTVNGQQAPRTIAPDGAVLPAVEVDKFLPGTLFFGGEQLFVESRNSEGIRFPHDMYTLAAPLDTSGHASDTDAEHLTCLVTEVPLEINGHKLRPGVYGVNLDDRRRFVMMDIAAHRMFIVSSRHDSGLLRPRPLQILASSQVHSYRLYLERNYVSISRIDGSVK